jgi:hypothetical protein
MGAADPANVSSKFREGWEPVRAEDYPELKYFSDAGSVSKFKDNIEIGGLLLCRTPQENVEARREYHDTLNQKQLEGVDNNFYRQRDAKTNMELFTERKSSVSFGRGNRT